MTATSLVPEVGAAGVAGVDSVPALPPGCDWLERPAARPRTRLHANVEIQIFMGAKFSITSGRKSRPECSQFWRGGRGGWFIERVMRLVLSP